MKKIKKAILILLLVIFKYHLKVIYFFVKLFTVRNNDVFLLSRQSNTPSLNYRILINELYKENISYKIICKKVATGMNSVIRNEKKQVNVLKEIGELLGYYFNLYKQMYYCAKSKVIIVDGYNVTASMLKHKKNTKIIQMWHSLGAIKKFGYQTIGYKDGVNQTVAKILCMHKNYDYIIGGTKDMTKYFSKAFNTDLSKMLAIGSPSVDYLLTENKDVENKLYERYSKLKKKINVLYSPTFRSDGTDNIDDVIEKYNNKKINLIITFHPKNEEFMSDKNVICVDREQFSTYDVMRICDYVITDYSALSIDAAILNKKVLLYLYDYEKYNKENGINIDLFKELKGNTFKDIDDVYKTIYSNSYNEESFASFKRKYAKFDNNNTEKLVKIIKENL